MIKKDKPQTFKYPGTRMAMDGNTAVIMCERESSDAAGAYPITPSTSVVDIMTKYRYLRKDEESGKYNMAIVQAEDELAAAGMIIAFTPFLAARSTIVEVTSG